MIPILDLKRQDEGIRGEIDAAIARVRDLAQYILGREVEAFEAAFAAYCGAKFCVGVASGTEALQIALRSCGVGSGDEVITVAHTAAATLAAVELAGARPVPVDIDPLRRTLDPERLPAAITPRTRAVIPVHLYGQPADLGPILEIADRHGLAVIEDCAQAHGALYRGKRAGAWGRAAAFSFYPTKNLGAYGDGGAVVTDDPEAAGRARAIRQYGWDDERISRRKGMNSRLDELQAAILLVKLRRLDAWNAERIRLAGIYHENLKAGELVAPRAAPDTTHVYHAYVVRHPRRDALRARLSELGVAARVRYPVPAHLQEGFRDLGLRPGDLPETEAAAREELCLPLFPGLRAEEQQAVVDAVNGF
jgi:dTDP-4-amino-4,6-dideoxygalactose transaminase